MYPHTATLEVNLAAIAANYRLLKERHARKNIAAVVKANAYGLGVEAVSKVLWKEGCREFFVATLEEGVELSELLPQASVGIFNGLAAGEEETYQRLRLTPVLNDVGQVERVAKLAVSSKQLAAILHIDTGMTRLGLSEQDLKTLLNRQLLTANCQFVMSHLACANDPRDAKNAEQLARFKAALQLLPGAKASLCNSSGLFLASEFHFDLARPGCALYGINPTSGSNPMQPVACLSAPLLQVRTLEQDETVGYGATGAARKGSRIAIAALGYADGWLRDLSNRGFAWLEGHKVPVLGRISMDMLALNISEVPEAKLTPASRAEFINAQQTVDDIAAACGTIGYEIFTRIGTRVKRIYKSIN